MPDYLIVGCGLAGIALSETLLQEGHSIAVFDDRSQKASRVAGGLYNPVVLKRLNLSWEGSLLMAEAIPFYRDLEQKLKVSVDEPLPVLRLFHAASEHNAWVEASDRPGLSEFLDPALLENDNPSLNAPHGFGKVLHTGRVHTGKLLETYREYLREQGSLKDEPFEYKALHTDAMGVSYKGLRAKAIVFCEGFGLRNNPYFNYLPLNGTKGELLVIHAPELKESRVIKSGVFIIPLGGDRYLVGATYGRNDYSPEPTAAAREWLLDQVRRFVRCEFEVVDHQAGIRPTVPDRRPLVGSHPGDAGMFVLNGLGSRGVLIAPFAARRLYRLMARGESLPQAMDCARFEGRFSKYGNKT